MLTTLKRESAAVEEVVRSFRRGRNTLKSCAYNVSGKNTLHQMFLKVQKVEILIISEYQVDDY